MIGIVIIAHGGLAVEYKSALEHVVGIQNNLIAIGIEENHDRKQKTKEICDCVNKVDSGAGVILVTDLFGGTPSNLSLEACSKENRIIVAFRGSFNIPNWEDNFEIWYNNFE